MMCELQTINMNTKTTLLVFLSLISILAATSDSFHTPSVVEITPSSVGILVQAFDHLVIYAYDQPSQQVGTALQVLQSLATQVKENYPDDNTIYGHVNLTNDYEGIMGSYTQKDKFTIVNAYETLNVSLSSTDSSVEMKTEHLYRAYQDHVHRRLNLGYKDRIIDKLTLSKNFVDCVLAQNPHKCVNYNLLFEYNSPQSLQFFNMVFSKIHHHAEQYGISVHGVLSCENKSKVVLYTEDKPTHEYSYYNRTADEFAKQLIQLLNTDSLDTVTSLGDHNFHRVFGGDVKNQIMFLYRGKIYEHQGYIDGVLSPVMQALLDFQKAAEFNRHEEMAFERVMFARTSSDFFIETFNEDLENYLKPEENFTILLTQTDYDRFQLKKYVMSEDYRPVTKESILRFIQDVKMRVLDPNYKSEPIPQEKDNKGLLRKIVGRSFISEVYEKPDQSVLVLFFDSKDPESYSELKEVVETFAVRQKDKIKDKLVPAIFDLAKNEHKLLYLKQAPQLVLFDHANKKKAKTYPLDQGIELEQITSWVDSQATNVSLQEPKMLEL